MPTIHAIDLSHWNTVNDFGKVADAGVVGILHKATEGTTYVDPTYASRRQKALAVGLRWGAYHFLKSGQAEQQMQLFLDTAQLPPGSRLAIDYEDDLCTLDDLHQAAAAIERLDHTAQIAIYSGSLLKEQLGSTLDKQLARYSLWLAQYTSGSPSWPKGTWKYYSLWQFTDGEAGGSPRSVPGIDPPMDCNTFNGSTENCGLWFGPVEPEPGDLIA